MKIKESIGIFLRGLGMGSADVVPGISGGTIALITGIYDRFIEGIRDVLDTPVRMREQGFLSSLKVIDWAFFIPLGLGILLALGMGSAFIPQLIELYPSYVYAFFVGLILASTLIIYQRIPEHKISGFFWGGIGIVAGLLFLLVPKFVETSPALWYLAIAGFFGISAMLLPGISGSYILLIFGVYEYILLTVHGLPYTWLPLLVFVGGIIAGLSALSHLISYLLRTHPTKTYFFLTGLMLGSILQPIRVVLEHFVSGSIPVLIMLFIVGAVGILLVERIAS